MIFVAVALATLSTPVCAKADPAQLIALHENARQAHLRGDAALLASGAAERIVMAEDGGVQMRTKADIAKFFDGYFKRVRYLEWRDIGAPQVTISPDGTLAWMAVGVQARYTAVDKPQDGEKTFKSSWIATYQRDNCDWRMTGMASDVVN